MTGSEVAGRARLSTHVLAEDLGVLAEVGDSDPDVGHVGENLLAELASATALN